MSASNPSGPPTRTEGPPPHGGRPVETAGAPLEEARAALVLLHGRGATARGILALAAEIEPLDPGATVGYAVLAPQAAGHQWYPDRFTAPLENNAVGLESALAVLSALVERLDAAGVPPDRVVLGGFSQGACLATEFAARNARRWGGVVGLSGGLIGPPGTPRDYGGSLEGAPVFLGCSDRDPHIPVERVHETAVVMERMGARVEERIYPGLGHTVNEDELRAVGGILQAAAGTEEDG